MLTNISCKDTSPMAFGKLPKPTPKVAKPNIPLRKLLYTIETLPEQDAKLGSLIIKDELFCKTLGAREVKVKPEKVRSFFKYLLATLKTTDPKLDKRPMPQRLDDLALFVRKVLATIHKINEEPRQAARRIAASYNEKI